MIFVTVGTHEQQFNRLIKEIDRLKECGVIKEEVVIQTGFSTYVCKNCKCEKIISYTQMIKYIEEARIVITHGGPATFIMPLQIGKIPVLVPRVKKYEEHVNDHQLEFAKLVEKRQKNIIVIEEVNELEKIIINYDSIVKIMPTTMKKNNIKFCNDFEKIINELIKK